MTTYSIASNISHSVILASGGTYGDPVTIASGVTVGGGNGVEVHDSGWTIRNEGDIQGSQSGIRQYGAGAVTIDNTGQITGNTGPGVLLSDVGALTNETGGFIYGAHGVSLSAGGSVTNASGAEIAGSYAGIFVNNGTLTADNAGFIHGGAYGMKLIHGGTITNEASGAIEGGGNGIEAAFGAGTVINAGLIEGVSFFAGVYLLSGGSVTNQVGGTIYGHIVGIQVNNGSSTVDNLGTLSGGYYGVRTGGINSTVENAGTISGGVQSVYLGASTNRLIVDPGAVFINQVAARASGTNTLELGFAASAGTFYGIDAHHYLNFQTVTIDSGATWDIGDISPFEVIENAGTIGLNSNTGLQLDDGAIVVNTGAIHGVEEGIWVSGAAGSVDNSGLITASGNGTVGDGVYLENGGNVTNETGATITGAEYGVRVVDAGTVINHGSIVGTGVDGVLLEDGGALTNAAGAAIRGKFFGVKAQGAVTIDNAGTIAATSAGHGKGVELDAGGRLTNETGGTITGSYSGVEAYQGGTVINHGSIASTGSNQHATGVVLGNASTLINDGTISGITGVYMLTSDGDTVTNAVGGVIAGDTYGIDTDVFSGPGTIDNAGTITGTSADGIFLTHGGTVTNAATGTITGHDAGVAGFGNGALSIGNAGTIQATLYGVDLSAANNTLDNSGLIVGGTGARFGGNTTTVDNSGTIHGTGVDDLSYGVKIYAATSGSLINEAGGTIIGAYGVTFLGANATLENAGRIAGNGYDAVQMLGTVTNRLVIDPGAVFEGKVVAGTSGTAANTIELKGGQIGALSGLGDKYAGFQTVTIDSGGSWTVAGSISGFAGITVEGFNDHTRLDLTNLAFDAGDTAAFDDGSNLLTIKDSNGDTLATINLDDSADGDVFQLLSDGHGGTYAEDDGFTPCYLKGTLIRTADGDVPVERLRIGHWVVTATGEALPVKWIGRRSYRDWLAVGNDDVQPILFKAGSIADGVPSRDLYVSPEHAMFVDGVLVPARHLVNGASILKCEGMDEIDYFHLEFDRHIVIFAEDAPAESFADDDSRLLFQNADEYRRLYPDEPRRYTEFCAPRVEDGPAVDALRQALATRAQHLRGDTAAPWGRRGKVELTTPRLITGWAYSGADAGPVPLAVLLNGAVIGRVIADRFRADLKAAGIGDGRHGFRFALPKGLAADIGHRIEIRRELDWSLL